MAATMPIGDASADNAHYAQAPMQRFYAGVVAEALRASALNRADLHQRRGQYPMPPGVSDLPGLEIAGVVEAGSAAFIIRAGRAGASGAGPKARPAFCCIKRPCRKARRGG
jgi:NADPH:quinone reductase-like Zn-dependent oxidoreductase